MEKRRLKQPVQHVEIHCPVPRAREVGSLLAFFLIFLGCSSEPGPDRIRLVEAFGDAVVEGRPGGAPVIEPTQWTEADLGNWTEANGISNLQLRDGKLLGRSSDEVPILHLDRGSDLPAGDQLYAIQIRLRTSDGANLNVKFDSEEEPDVARLVRGTKSGDVLGWSLSTPLVEGGDTQTYTITADESFFTTSFPSSRLRHILLRPTDAADAEFEIESLRLIFRSEHLASIASGVSWQGFSDVFRETIVSRVPETIRFDLTLPQNPWLDLAIGMVEPEPVTFHVTIHPQGDAQETVLFKRTLTTNQRWELAPVELDEFSGQSVSLELRLQGGKEGDLGLWGSPVIRSHHANPERVATQTAERPEAYPSGVVLIVGDTLRRDHLNAYGYSRSTAPALAGLAANGVLFQDNQSQGTWTKVSVPAILTSLYPSTHGIVDIPDRLPASVVTLAEVFQEAGYATWASASVAFTGQLSNLHQGVEVLHERGSVQDRGSKTARPFTDQLLPWLEMHRDVPFFAFLHVFDPHSPFKPRSPYDALWTDQTRREKFEKEVESVKESIGDETRKGRVMPYREEIQEANVDPEEFVQFEKDWYDGSIRGLDAEVARVIELLEQLGLRENTLIVFMSDHGEEFLEHGRQWHGNTVYGEMTNVPLILNWPAGLPQGRVVEQTTQSIDLMPTLLDLSGLRKPESLQGDSLLELIYLGGEEDVPDFWEDRPVFSERIRPPLESGRMDAQQPAYPNLDSYAIVQGGWKLIQNSRRPPDHPEFELFDHVQDPLNLNNLADQQTQVVERLSARLQQWHERMEAARVNPEENQEGLDPAELERLRSLGYIR